MDNEGTEQQKTGQTGNPRRDSFTSQNSQTAREYIDSQLRLEADAREVLPYSFDSCTQPLGPLRQSLFACITCNPPPANPEEPSTSAGVCYSCSISCHGEHTLVELFNKRNFVCDCGTSRLSNSTPCALREDPQTGAKGVCSQEPAASNRYNHNFQNRFCGCGENYDAQTEKGTMFQCLGLGTVESGGCGEDWWHPECLIGLPRDWFQTAKKEGKVAGNPHPPGTDDVEDDEETPLPPGFPAEDDFDTFLCFKCVESNPWLKRYAGTPGFLPPVYENGGLPKASSDSNEHKQNVPTGTLGTIPEEEEEKQPTTSKKRKADDGGDEENDEPECKRTKEATETEPESKPNPESTKQTIHKHDSLPATTTSSAPFSLFLKDDFRAHLCHCPTCYPNLTNHPQLREEEDTYEPPLSDDGHAGAGASTGTGSLLDRGEAALSNIDRVRAIEGAMVYNHLRDKVKEFLKPFAESGQAVGAEDIKAYFEKLRGDEPHIQDAAAAGRANAEGNPGGDGGDHDGSGGGSADGRREQSGY